MEKAQIFRIEDYQGTKKKVSNFRSDAVKAYRDHVEFHRGKDFAGLLITTDDDGYFKVSTAGNLEENQAEALLLGVLETLYGKNGDAATR